MITEPIYPCLWFDGQAQEAAYFYCSIFKNSKILDDTQLVVTFELEGNKYMALNGGPLYKFTEAVSFVITCETQEDIDYYWSKLTEGGQESMCGWLKDKFGVSWQIIPAILLKLMNDPAKSEKIIKEFGNIVKFDIEQLMKV
jgi:predicted 3-demethylubiquinone-9 3-methyltransferase (glyoxalase superfamily)